ncbi:TylF/MycF/NovP-related O-methyltransferase [Niabella soli]|uniref:Macrocin-O-methyltransferase TylF n=1 Tax=Niabella soli DSM 19437 TaxID=929713 RepID=W0F601_9BACT|nr:TylF/MycF/NovP-related O-methyltransferase [Niabella soli]AHF16894.1 macrocin-O-methyltransferase TylF [Niabella soli DSM 19437]
MTLSKRLFRFVSGILADRDIYLTRSLTYRKKERLLPLNLDYIRYSTLELCAEEILSRHLDGNIAEVGVFKGDFAKRLNRLFPDKKLYLFDTFEGFNTADIAADRSRGFSAGDQNFSETSIPLVKAKMIHPENCIFKKGFFPDTAKDVEDTFCFVSLDTDLYAPIYEGLQFFYPRLVSGGYIFVHDFNNEQYKGARQAVIQFCNEQQLSYTPLPDSGGTAILTK